jgi:GntR family transcriptional regulator / MocR family aminotransferase
VPRLRTSSTTASPGGEKRLRAVLAEHLGRTRGTIAEPSQIMVVQGTAQGFDLLLRVLHARGASRVAVEDPSHTTQAEDVCACGMALIARRIDGGDERRWA